MEISVHLFDKICRICLIQSMDLKSLFTKTEDGRRNLLEILAFTANIDVKLEDSLPKQLCSACEGIMWKLDSFKRRCHESETILNNIYRNSTAATELVESSLNFHIKDEQTGIKEKLSEYGTFLSPIPTNSGFKDDFSKKTDFSLCSSTELSSNKLSVPDLPDTYKQTVKMETESCNEDANDLLDVYDDGGQYESLPFDDEPEKPKPESTKIGVRYECYCHTQFTCKDDYQSHLKANQCNAGKVLKCKMINNGDNKVFQCSFCLRQFKYKSSLAAHIQRHEENDSTKHVCEICKREFKYKAYLENHVFTVHSKKNDFTCYICVKSFSNKEALETHKKSHDSDKKHHCTVCSKAFTMLCTLKEHMRTHTGEKPFLCSQCGKGFSQKTNLAQHTRRHQGLKAYKCETCEKRFVSKGELDAHTRKHSGAHPFVCDDCGNGFTTSSALVKHRRIHTGERPYQCDLCPMRFAASGTLTNHRRTHTGERPFQCSYCEKAFVQRNDLISHIRCHTGERPYICTQCGQSFRKASGLKTHVKMHIK